MLTLSPCEWVAFSFNSYSAAAVITKEDGVDDVKYLDKFTVGRQSQVRFKMHLNQNQDTGFAHHWGFETGYF